MIIKFIFNLLLIVLLNYSFNLSNAYTQDVKNEEESTDFFFGDDKENSNEVAPIADGGLIYNIDTDDIILEANDPDPFFEAVINLEEQSGLTTTTVLETSVKQPETVNADISQDEAISIAEQEKKPEIQSVQETEIQESEETLFDETAEIVSSVEEPEITSPSNTETPSMASSISSDSDKLSEITAFRAKVDSMDAKTKAKALKSNKKKFIKEQKTTVKGYKKLTPDEILNLQEELASKEGAVERLESEMSNCKRDNLSMKNEVLTLKAQLEQALKDIEELKANPPVAVVETVNTNTVAANGQKDDPSKSLNTSAGNTMAKGIVFKVQLGAYQQFNLGQNTIAGQKVEVDNVSGWKKYTAGSFTNYKDASDFKKEVNNTGMTDAFIVAYKDGVRIDMKTAIESVLGR